MKSVLSRIAYVPHQDHLAIWVMAWSGSSLKSLPSWLYCVVSFLLKEMKPRALCPDELFTQPGMKDFLEWSSLWGWMKDWLRYCNWYYRTAMDPEVDGVLQCSNGQPKMEDHFTWAHCGSFRSSMEGFRHGGFEGFRQERYFSQSLTILNHHYLVTSLVELS